MRGARRAHAPADLLAAAAVLRRARQHDVAQGDGGKVDTKNIQWDLASPELRLNPVKNICDAHLVTTGTT